MSQVNLLKTPGITGLTDVTLASGGDKGPNHKDVLFACNLCDKSYDKKSSYQSHMRLKHKAGKEVEMEKGTQTTQKKKGLVFYQWIENEKDKNLQRTRELDSFLANKSDANMIEAAREMEEAEEQVERLVRVKNHEVEWFEENNMIEFSREFESDFASSLRRESIAASQPTNKLAELHNEMMKKQIEKYDAMMIRTTRMLNTAENAKKDLRKWKKQVEKELAETQENWQATSEADSEEISGLKATVAAQKIKINELELAATASDRGRKKCEKCDVAPKKGETVKPVKAVHGGKVLVKCTKCPQLRANAKDMRKHMKTHLPELEYACEICQKTFKTLNEARTHSQGPCGNIKQKRVVIDIEESVETHSCNACATSYHSNDELEMHMEKHHAADCLKCHTTFKSQDDVYKHANVCTKVIEPFICNKCNRELISKTGLNKHMERCKREERDATKAQVECWNGTQCKFFRYNKCSYFHPQKSRSEEPWQTVDRRRPKQSHSDQAWACNKCNEKFTNWGEKRTHKCQHEQNNRKNTIAANTNKKDIECFRGPNCFRLANNTCWFKHTSVQKTSPHGGHKASSNTTFWCKFQDKCTRSSCTYKHFDPGFQKTQSRRNQ